MLYIYRPPNSPVAWYDRFRNESEKVSYLNFETILTGDFNIDLLQPGACFRALQTRSCL